MRSVPVMMIIYCGWVLLLLFETTQTMETNTVLSGFLTARDVFRDEECNMALSKLTFPHLRESCCIKSQYSDFSTICVGKENFLDQLPTKTGRLLLKYTSIASLTNNTFNRTRLSLLNTLSIIDDMELSRIEGNSFSGLVELMHIYIENVKKLEYIAGSAFSDIPRIHSIHLINTGLKRLCGFSEYVNQRPAYWEKATLYVYRNPYLERIEKNAFHNSAPDLYTIKIRENPSLKYIEDFAFNGSLVAILYLDNNKALTEIFPFAFARVYYMKNLSIANTAVKNLPTVGLANLRFLNAQNVPNMIRFPKRSEVKNLKEAKLTYPYHCCAINRKYGFGQIFTNEKLEEEGKTLVSCDTGQEVQLGWVDTHEPQGTNVGSGAVLLPVSSEAMSSWSEEAPLLNSSIVDYNSLPKYYHSDLNYSAPSNITESEFTDDPWYSVDIFKENNVTVEESWAVENDPYALPKPDTKTPKTPEVQQLCYISDDGRLVRIIHKPIVRCTPQSNAFNPCENLLGHIALSVLSCFVGCLAVLGNLVVIVTSLYVAFDRSKQRHLTVTKFLIFNLAIADFLLGVYILRLAVKDLESKESYYMYGVEWQLMGGCKAVGFLAVFSSQLSIFTLSVISLERWYAIKYAIHLEKRMTMKFAGAVMGVAWILSFIFALLPLVGVNDYGKTAVCLPFDVDQVGGKVYLFFLLTIDLIAFVVVVGCYFSMYLLVTKTSRAQTSFRLRSLFQLKRNKSSIKNKPKNDIPSKSRDEDARLARRMAALVFTDFLCFFPICFFSLFAAAGLPFISLSISKILLVVFFPLNSFSNPFLYAIMTKSFREDVWFFIKFLKQISVKKDQRKKLPPVKKLPPAKKANASTKKNPSEEQRKSSLVKVKEESKIETENHKEIEKSQAPPSDSIPSSSSPKVDQVNQDGVKTTSADNDVAVGDEVKPKSNQETIATTDEKTLPSPQSSANKEIGVGDTNPEYNKLPEGTGDE